MNVSGGSAAGMQVSSLLNLTAEDMAGLQLSTLGNVVGKELKGVQIGLANMASRGKGFQIGLFNYYKEKFDGDHHLLCYLYLENKTFINAHLLKAGLAEADIDTDYKYKNKFIALQQYDIS